jgi:hypothetical protein
MATNYTIALTNAERLDRIILFTGLGLDIVISPQLLGEPVLTAQAYYFLDDLDSVAIIRFNNKYEFDNFVGDSDFEEKVESLLENYCFSLSQKYPDSTITPKVQRGKFWVDNPDTLYHKYDKMNSHCLILDTLNDDTIKKCEASNGDIHFYDWCMIKNYSLSALERYIKELSVAKNINISIKLSPENENGPLETTLPIITHDITFTYHEAMDFEIVSPDRFDKTKSIYKISRGFNDGFSFPQEVIESTEFHNRELLAYYLTAIRELSPLSKFRNLYNVLEYFYGEIGDLPKRKKKKYSEQEMLIAAMNHFITNTELISIFKSTNIETLRYFLLSHKTSSGIKIQELSFNSENIIKSYCERLYGIRNACIHSKKIRHGNYTPRFIPSRNEENLIYYENTILQKIASIFIERNTLYEKLQIRLLEILHSKI